MSTESKFNTEVFKTRYGIVRLVELAISFCGIISMSSGYYCSHFGKYGFYEFVTVTSLIFIIVFFIIMVLKLDVHLIRCINLPLSFLINDAILTLFYLIASILLFIAIGVCSWGKIARIFASIFGVINFLCFGVSTLEDYRWFQSGAAPFPLSQTTPTSAQPA